MMDLTIRNINDLRGELVKLERSKQEQEMALKARLNSPGSVISALWSLFPHGHDGPKTGSIFNQDMLGLLSRVAIPFTLNKTVFKNSGFLVKTLIGLLSQKASTYVSEDTVTGVWDKAKGLVTNLFKKDKDHKAEHPHIKSAVL